MVFEWFGLSWLSELCFTQGKQVGHCSVSMFWVERWSGKLGWLGQLIWLFGWMVSVVKLVKWLGCWNQVVRMIYQTNKTKGNRAGVCNPQATTV